MKVKTSIYVQTTMNYIRFLVRYLLLNVKEMEKTTGQSEGRDQYICTDNHEL